MNGISWRNRPNGDLLQNDGPKVSDLLLFVAIGFAAQIVDGAIGMAYGLISTTVLLSLGIPPATASASVHAAEVFTTGASGLSHWRFGNLDKRLFWKLAPAGMIGGGLGAYVLTAAPGDAIRPIVGIYLGIMGAVVLWKAFQREERREPATCAAHWLRRGVLGCSRRRRLGCSCRL